MANVAQRILRQGSNVWKTAPAVTSGVIVDSADYYLAFYEAARRAKRTILLSGWQFDRGVPLLRGSDAPAGTEVRLLKFLNELCEQKPDLEIYILAWDFHVVFALEREWMQTLYFEWATHKRLHFRFDDALPPEGSHHQKFAIVDRVVSFVGGIDLCEARWDDRRHLQDNPLRLSHGEPVKPYHDTQAYFTGCEVADVLRELFVDRWKRAGAEPLELAPCEPPEGADYLPRGALSLGPAEVAFSRTDPRGPGQSVCEVKHLFVDAITAAEHLIYVETQYFSSRAIADALIARMRRHDGSRLQIVIVLNVKPEALKEEIAVGLRQAKILLRLTDVAVETGHALGIYDTLCEGDAPDRPSTYIHTKLLVVDDAFLTVGSANLTNRSMGVDTELHVSWEVAGAAGRGHELASAIAGVRVSLLAEHSGLGTDAGDDRAASELAPIDGLVERLDRLTTVDNARLRKHVAASERDRQIIGLIDPEKLPFDPVDIDYDEDTDGSAEEKSQSGAGFARGIAGLWEKVKA